MFCKCETMHMYAKKLERLERKKKGIHCMKLLFLNFLLSENESLPWCHIALRNFLTENSPWQNGSRWALVPMLMLVHVPVFGPSLLALLLTVQDANCHGSMKPSLVVSLPLCLTVSQLSGLPEITRNPGSWESAIQHD